MTVDSPSTRQHRISASDRSRQILDALVAFGVLGWAFSLVLAPYIARVSRVGGGLLYAIGALICHQRPERSFYVAGAQLPVCARCAGLYVGAALGVLAWSLLAGRRTREWPRTRALAVLGIAALPTVVTVGTALTGIGDPPNAWRFGFAVPLGLAGGVIVGAVVSKHLK